MRRADFFGGIALPSELPATPWPVQALTGVLAGEAAASSPALRPMTLVELDAATFWQRLLDARVVDNTAMPISPPRWLIVNAANVEPGCAADSVLLHSQGADVLAAAACWQRALRAECAVIAVKGDDADALTALNGKGSSAAPIDVIALPDRYPAGHERVVIEAVTGLRLRHGEAPTTHGVMVIDVATAVAGLRASRDGERRSARVVTVAGAGVKQPGNFLVPFGTPASDVVAAAGGYTDRAAALIVGGRMTGQAAADDSIPITALTTALQVLSQQDIDSRGPAQACIRCGDCAPVCPARLHPQRLHAALSDQRLDRAVDDGLLDCMECGLCDVVCPSQIRLLDGFRSARVEALATQQRRAIAHAAEQRHAARAGRLQRRSAELAEQQAQRQRKAASAAQAALARARAKKAAADSSDDGVESP